MFGGGRNASRNRNREGGNGFALPVPSGRAVEVGRGWLQHVEHEPARLVSMQSSASARMISPSATCTACMSSGKGRLSEGCRRDGGRARGFEAASAKVEVEVAVITAVESGRITEVRVL